MEYNINKYSKQAQEASASPIMDGWEEGITLHAGALAKALLKNAIYQPRLTKHPILF
jgi:hypothetical protein